MYRQNQTKSNKVWHIVFGMAAVVIFAQLIVTNILAVQGSEAARLDKNILQIERENQMLREELSAKSSIMYISERAFELGLVEPQAVFWVDLSQPVAVLP